MSHVYYVPGYLGSTLSSDQAGSNVVWVSYTQLMLGQCGQLRLSADGVTPQPPYGVQLHAQGPIPSYYADAIAVLERSLIPGPEFVIPFGWDFRFAISVFGSTLASLIIQDVSADDPCTIVAHSAGGLVARSAWSSLTAAGQSGLVRRIITIGTPHQGSYTPIALMSGDNSSLDQLAALAALTAGFVAGLIPAAQTYLSTRPQLLAVVASWPSIYELWPLLGGTDAAGDPHRRQLYDASLWSGVSLSQPWLDASLNSWGPWLLSPASMPPPWVLTTVAGDGIPTASTLLRPASLGRPSAYGSTAAGDGSVSTTSALIPTSWQYSIPCRHWDLPLVTAQMGMLRDLIRDQRSPPTPIPAVEDVAAVVTPRLADPPVPSIAFAQRPAGGIAGDP